MRAKHVGPFAGGRPAAETMPGRKRMSRPKSGPFRDLEKFLSRPVTRDWFVIITTILTTLFGVLSVVFIPSDRSQVEAAKRRGGAEIQHGPCQRRKRRGGGDHGSGLGVVGQSSPLLGESFQPGTCEWRHPFQPPVRPRSRREMHEPPTGGTCGASPQIASACRSGACCGLQLARACQSDRSAHPLDAWSPAGRQAPRRSRVSGGNSLGFWVY